MHSRVHQHIKYWNLWKMTSTASLLRWGLCSIIRSLLRVKPDGLMLGGPPCGSYVFINRGTSKRSQWRHFGDCSLKYVRDANMILGLKKLFLWIVSHCMFFGVSDQCCVWYGAYVNEHVCMHDANRFSPGSCAAGCCWECWLRPDLCCGSQNNRGARWCPNPLTFALPPWRWIHASGAKVHCRDLSYERGFESLTLVKKFNFELIFNI